MLAELKVRTREAEKNIPTYFIMTLFGKDKFLAVDIGTTSIKIGEFQKTGDRIELVNYGFLESRAHLDGSGSAIQTSSFRMLEPLVVDYIKKLLKRMRVRTKTALVSLPAFSAFTTLVELPKMSEEDTEKAIPFQSKQYIPAPLSTVRIEWFPAGERKNTEGNAMQRVFIVSVPYTTINKYKRVFKSAGLHFIGAEVESISLARVITAGNSETTLIIDIGSRSTSISVAESGSVRLASQTDFAGESLTKVIAMGLDITLSRAEALKIQKGLSGTGGNRGLSTLMTPMLDAIISEVARTRRSFEDSYQRSVKSVVISGGTARLSGIKEYFNKQLNLPIKIADPFTRIIYPQSIQFPVGKLSPRFAVVLGLAMKKQS